MTAMNTQSATTLLTIPEVAQELRVTRSTVYRYISDKVLPTVHIGPKKLTRVARTDLDAFIAKSRRAA